MRFAETVGQSVGDCQGQITLILAEPDQHRNAIEVDGRHSCDDGR